MQVHLYMEQLNANMLWFSSFGTVDRAVLKKAMRLPPPEVSQAPRVPAGWTPGRPKGVKGGRRTAVDILFESDSDSEPAEDTSTLTPAGGNVNKKRSINGSSSAGQDNTHKRRRASSHDLSRLDLSHDLNETPPSSEDDDDEKSLGDPDSDHSDSELSDRHDDDDDDDLEDDDYEDEGNIDDDVFELCDDCAKLPCSDKCNCACHSATTHVCKHEESSMLLFFVLISLLVVMSRIHQDFVLCRV